MLRTNTTVQAHAEELYTKTKSKHYFDKNESEIL